MSELVTPTAIEKLEKQNEKLRQSLKELTATLASIREKQRTSRSPEPTLSDSKDKHGKLDKLKQEIKRINKELEGNQNVHKCTEFENSSKYLSKRIEELEAEKKKLAKIEKKHENELNTAFSAESYTEKIHQLKEEIRQKREKIKELNIKVKTDDRTLKTQHEKCVTLEERCRKLYEMIKIRRKEEEEGKSKQDDPEIDGFILSNIEDKIKKAEESKIEEENKLKGSIKELESQISEAKHNLEMVKIKYKEKDQECRLCLLKIRELRKLTKHNQLQPLKRIAANSASKLRSLSPQLSKEVENPLDIEVGDAKRNVMRKRSSGLQKMFHQETVKIVEKMKQMKEINFK
jgi:DNA repair exonuclease SbcCD ATPase subunit